MDIKEIEKLLTSGNIKQFAMRLLEEWGGGGKDLTDEEIRKGTVHSPDERKTAVIFTDMIRKKKREKRNEKTVFELQWLK